MKRFESERNEFESINNSSLESGSLLSTNMDNGTRYSELFKAISKLNFNFKTIYRQLISEIRTRD